METTLAPTETTALWIEATGEEVAPELSRIPADMAAGLIQRFLPYAQALNELAADAHGIDVTDEADTAGMAEARRLRLAIKAVRVEAEKVRKNEKEYALVISKAVDFLGRSIRERAEIVEARLESCEKFAELREAERRAALAAERAEILRPICDDVTGFDLASMTPEAFEKLRAGLQAAHDQAERERAEAEAARVAAAEAERIERERMRKENERLRAENAAKQAEADRLAAELKAKADAEAAAERASREAERAAANANDVEKMRALYRQIEAIKMPEVAAEYDETLLEVAGRLQSILAYISAQMNRATR